MQKKNTCSIAVLRNIPFLELPKNKLMRVYKMLRYIVVFAKLFPLAIFSIRNFNLCNLKGNGNTAKEKRLEFVEKKILKGNGPDLLNRAN